jgi:16S rRNA (adenine1518-N6/adenine1519-N6)-dimethyltransferase
LPRRLGQHFLTNNSILQSIAESACGSSTERAIEIGPGRGALTRHLLSRTNELHAIEIDQQLIPVLEASFQKHENFHLHHADVMETDLAQWGPAVIVGNLPYYITSPIVHQFLILGAGFPRAVFLVQEEVADRLRAKPGSRDYGYLSVQTQLFCRIEVVAKVPPGAFSPPPKVDSAVVRLERFAVVDQSTAPLLTFVSRCFTHKRKTLRNNLRPYYTPQALNSIPEANQRAEQLSLETFAEIRKRLSNFDPTGA